ncbi:membrane anchor subunit of succinate dehydrogenase, Sdh4 [Zalaria obscura]|uniref:Membrane anchor subunit of succinate dehydrogenase, Sdh4 n=1 Tax=Zalaria obscura TaxID=2024903 RepID=A0ACC3S5G8_9PEZI
MASALRPTMLRQAFAAAAPAQRCFSTAMPAFRAAQLARQQPIKSAFVRNALPGATRVAAFHASPARAILPPLPQVIKGTVNDAAQVPDPTPMHGSYHWSFERIMSAGLIPLTVAPFATGSLNPTLDSLLIAGILIHSHIGFESVIIDYVPEHRMPRLRKLLMWALKAATVVVGIGFYEFETNDVGLTEAIKRVWKA